MEALPLRQAAELRQRGFCPDDPIAIDCDDDDDEEREEGEEGAEEGGETVGEAVACEPLPLMHGLDRLVFVRPGCPEVVVTASEVMDRESVSHLEGGAAIPPSAFRLDRLVARVGEGQRVLVAQTPSGSVRMPLESQEQFVRYLSLARPTISDALRAGNKSVHRVQVYPIDQEHDPVPCDVAGRRQAFALLSAEPAGDESIALPLLASMEQHVFAAAFSALDAASRRAAPAPTIGRDDRILAMALAALCYATIECDSPLLGTGLDRDMADGLVDGLARGPHLVFTDQPAHVCTRVASLVGRGGLMTVMSLDGQCRLRLVEPLDATGLSVSTRSILPRESLFRQPNFSAAAAAPEMPPERLIVVIDALSADAQALRRQLGGGGEDGGAAGTSSASTLLRPCTVVRWVYAPLDAELERLIREMTPGDASSCASGSPGCQ